MRIRSIKPEFFKHDVLCEMTPLSRLLFIGLWCMADCAGRMEDRGKRIKVEVLPYDGVDVEELLSALSTGGMILRYEVDGQRLIEIPSFARHQRISGKEADGTSRFPPPSKKKTGKQRGSNGEATGITGDGRETEGKGDDGFDTFWAVYPKKKARDKAKAAFAKITVPIEVLIAAVQKSAQGDDWRKERGKFIPHASTWLNGKRWEDQEEVELFTPPPRPVAPYDAPPEY